MIVSRQLEEAQNHAEWLLGELDGEVIHYLSLRHKLNTLPQDHPEREQLEGDLYAWLTQLESTTIQAREALDAVTDAMPEGE